MSGPDAFQSVLAAVRMGYRHIDCAPVYNNEKEVSALLGTSSHVHAALHSPAGGRRLNQPVIRIYLAMPLSCMYSIHHMSLLSASDLQVGEAFQQLFKEGTVKREELFVTSKIL